MKLSDTLPRAKNGAYIICQHGEFVLCYWDSGNAEGTDRPWVTWRMDENRSTYSGHYFGTLDAAANEYEQRAKVKLNREQMDVFGYTNFVDELVRWIRADGVATAELRFIGYLETLKAAGEIEFAPGENPGKLGIGDFVDAWEHAKAKSERGEV
jgi:hypothetical protein